MPSGEENVEISRKQSRRPSPIQIRKDSHESGSQSPSVHDLSLKKLGISSPSDEGILTIKDVRLDNDPMDLSVSKPEGSISSPGHQRSSPILPGAPSPAGLMSPGRPVSSSSSHSEPMHQGSIKRKASWLTGDGVPIMPYRSPPVSPADHVTSPSVPHFRPYDIASLHLASIGAKAWNHPIYPGMGIPPVSPGFMVPPTQSREPDKPAISQSSVQMNGSPHVLYTVSPPATGSRDSRASPRLGWVAVSQQEVRSIVDNVMQEALLADDVKEEGNNRTPSPQDSSGHSSPQPMDTIKQRRPSSRDITSSVTSQSEPCDSPRDVGTPDSISVASEADSVDTTSSSKKAFKWKKNLLERMNEEGGSPVSTTSSSPSVRSQRSTSNKSQ